MIVNYIRLLRIHQWVKNLFVFAPIFFGLRLFDWHLMQLSVQAFLAFCCVASSMYILNDILDVKADRQHIHYRLVDAGLTHLQSTATLLAVSMLMILLSFFRSW